MRREEGPHIVGNPRRSERPARPGSDEGRELGVGHADARVQVRGDGVQQRGDDSGLTAVKIVQTVQSHVGDAQLVPLHTVADPLERAEDLLEYQAVVRLVGVQNDGIRCGGTWPVPRSSPQPRRTPPGSGPPPRGRARGLTALDDDDGTVLQMGMPSHLHLGSRVR